MGGFVVSPAIASVVAVVGIAAGRDEYRWRVIMINSYIPDINILFNIPMTSTVIICDPVPTSLVALHR